MSKADEIRRLAKDGLAVAEIARQLGIPYQHAYGVLRKNGTPDASVVAPVGAKPALKPPLSVEILKGAGFVSAGSWVLSHEAIVTLERPLPKHVGVYAFAQAGIVKYVGVATMGLAKRIYFYGRPGVTQKTSLRINALLVEELRSRRVVEILVAQPEDLEWHGLPVHGAAGLELGLIKRYALPWNKRSAG